MRAIPGYVEPSQDYLNYQSLDLSWVEDMYSSKSQPRPSTAIDSMPTIGRGGNTTRENDGELSLQVKQGSPSLRSSVLKVCSTHWV